MFIVCIRENGFQLIARFVILKALSFGEIIVILLQWFLHSKHTHMEDCVHILGYENVFQLVYLWRHWKQIFV